MIGRIFSTHKGSKKSTKRSVRNLKRKDVTLDVKVDLNKRGLYAGS